MSMFHELMMRKKEENFLYPVIKGSLTESPSGVFSGFSSSNYLEKATSISLSIQELEVVLDIIMTSFASEGLCVFSTNTFNVQFYSQSTTYKKMNLGGSQITGTKNYLLNTNYKIKLKFYVVGSSIHLDIYYLEGSNWILDVSYTNLPYTLISKFILGDNYSHTGTRVFTGSYNLNNSYMILDGTKYNLQAVVGYTVVGSPTITDGVVSGFSGTDYVQTPNPKIDNTPFEFFVSFAMGNDMTGQQNLLTENNLNMRLYKLSSDNCFKFRFYDKNASDILAVTLDYTIQADTSYKYKVRYNNSILVIAIYDNANNLLAENSISNVSPLINDQIKIGSLGTSNGYLKGSIDLNNTYIKINNKLWFNGQQA